MDNVRAGGLFPLESGWAAPQVWNSRFTPSAHMARLTQPSVAMMTQIGLQRGTRRLTPLLASLAVLACAPPSAVVSSNQAPMQAGANPLLTVSTLPYQAPRFDLIRNEHYEPAIEEGMRQ